ncbi:MAG: hypothetical protein M3X11_09295 [Acidobacteriota bacterium]|nr:hypothetical protein [Acidobacteriota bacterium]
MLFESVDDDDCFDHRTVNYAIEEVMPMIRSRPIIIKQPELEVIENILEPTLGLKRSEPLLDFTFSETDNPPAQFPMAERFVPNTDNC